MIVERSAVNDSTRRVVSADLTFDSNAILTIRLANEIILVTGSAAGFEVTG